MGNNSVSLPFNCTPYGRTFSHEEIEFQKNRRHCDIHRRLDFDLSCPGARQHARHARRNSCRPRHNSKVSRCDARGSRCSARVTRGNASFPRRHANVAAIDPAFFRCAKKSKHRSAFEHRSQFGNTPRCDAAFGIANVAGSSSAACRRTFANRSTSSHAAVRITDITRNKPNADRRSHSGRTTNGDTVLPSRRTLSDGCAFATAAGLNRPALKNSAQEAEIFEMGNVPMLRFLYLHEGRATVFT